MSTSVGFFAAGRPRTKGSTRTFKHPSTGALVTTGMNPHSKAWQGVVACAAADAGVQLAPSGAGVEVTFTFVFERPKSHRTSKGALTKGAPVHCTTHNLGDLDKLERCGLDALTGVAYVDDSQVVRAVSEKRWRGEGDPCEGAYVTVQVRA